jgi:hypothetical protein
MATIEEALEQLAIGKSISSTIWTQTPNIEGFEPESGMEYQVKWVITKIGIDSYTEKKHILASRPRILH